MSKIYLVAKVDRSFESDSKIAGPNPRFIGIFSVENEALNHALQNAPDAFIYALDLDDPAMILRVQIETERR